MAIALSAAACNDGPCPTLPCPSPLAAEITVTSAIPGVQLSGVFINIGTGNYDCSTLPVMVCLLGYPPGTYQYDVGAPGFQTTHRTIVVTGSSPKCGCPRSDTQHLDIALVPAT
jgi:hypothetical protein